MKKQQKVKVWITWEIRDSRDNLKSRSVHVAKSLVQHFINILYCNWSQTTLASQTDTGGTSRTMQVGAASVAAAAADSTYGLVVGTGSTAVAVTETKLVTQITHGTGAGQLSHGTTTVTAPTTSGTTRSFTIQRTFTNNTAGAITVNEVGIYGVATYKFMLERALSTKTINAGTSGTLTYTLQVTV